jgi:hypothetical protein
VSLRVGEKGMTDSHFLPRREEASATVLEVLQRPVVCHLHTTCPEVVLAVHDLILAKGKHVLRIVIYIYHGY